MLTRILGAAVISVASGGGAAIAQEIPDPNGPAEQPPASFSGEQYVDSDGCAFLRAGFSGQVIWVPMLDENRQPACGQVPSMAPRDPKEGQMVEALAPQAPQVEVAQPEPRRAPQIHKEPAPRQARATRPAQPQRYVYVVPPHPAQRAMPKGYRSAWDDGRLNPRRAQGTAVGDARMRRVWSNDVPMELIDPDATVPWAHLVPLEKMPVRGIPLTRAAPGGKDAYVSSRGTAAPPLAQPPVAGGQGYVQVGSFGIPANARAAAQRFQSMGLPVRVQQTRRGGQILEVVLIGPFAASHDLGHALDAARRAGFRDAFTRG